MHKGKKGMAQNFALKPGSRQGMEALTAEGTGFTGENL